MSMKHTYCFAVDSGFHQTRNNRPYAIGDQVDRLALSDILYIFGIE